MLEKNPEHFILLIEKDETIAGNLDYHRHTGYELRFIFDAEKKCIEKIHLVLPDIYHNSLNADLDEKSYVLHLSPQGSFYRYGLNESGVFHSPYLNRLLNVFDSLIQMQTRPAEWAEELYYMLLLLHLRAETFPEKFDPEKKVEQVISYLQTFYYHKDLSIQDVFCKFGCNPRTSQKTFRALTGKSPNEYLQCIRMQNAKKLLAEKRYLVKEVAALCGFSDAHYFANRFKKFFQHSPTDESDK